MRVFVTHAKGKEGAPYVPPSPREGVLVSNLRALALRLRHRAKSFLTKFTDEILIGIPTTLMAGVGARR